MSTGGDKKPVRENLTETEKAQAVGFWLQGAGFEDIASVMGVSVWAVRLAVDKYKKNKELESENND